MIAVRVSTGWMGNERLNDKDVAQPDSNEQQVFLQI